MTLDYFATFSSEFCLVWFFEGMEFRDLLAPETLSLIEPIGIRCVGQISSLLYPMGGIPDKKCV